MGKRRRKEKKNTQVVEVPLESDYALYSKVHTLTNGKDTVSSAWYYSQNRLMICKKGVDNYSMFQITIVPVAASNSETEQMLEDFEYSGRKGMFSGYVFCSTLDGQCYRIFKYENGEIVKLLNKASPRTETINTTPYEPAGLTTADTLAQNIKPRYKFSFSYQALSRSTLIIWERDENGELVGHIGEVTVNPPDDYEEGDELPIGIGENDEFIYENSLLPTLPSEGGGGGSNSGSDNNTPTPTPAPNEPLPNADGIMCINRSNIRLNFNTSNLQNLWIVGGEDCMKVCKYVIDNKFSHMQHEYGSVTKTYRLVSRTENNGTDIEHYHNSVDEVIITINRVINCIEEHLLLNRPIIVGLDTGTRKMILNKETNKREPANKDDTTDHFVLIIGQGYDAYGFYYEYIETGTSISAYVVNNIKNRIYFNESSKMFKGKNQYEETPPTYTISHVRPNKDYSYEGLIRSDSCKYKL